MALMILGLVIFFAVHTFTTLRVRREAAITRLGAMPYRALYSILSIIGFVLIVKGYGDYRAAGYTSLWDPPRGLRHAAVLLMWPASIALAATYAPAGVIKAKLKHPMLVGVKIWALAHLLANGDAGSVILFGAFLGWSVYDRIAIKRRGETSAAVSGTPAGFGRGDIVAIAGGTVAYAVMLKLHSVLIGVSVFG